MDQLPPLRDPWMVVAFDGPSDAGDTGSELVEHLAVSWDASTVREFDPDTYLDYRESRPQLVPDEHDRHDLVWPRLRIQLARGASRDVLLLHGPEPALRWRQFCTEVVDLAVAAGVRTLVTVAGVHDEVPHTHPVAVSAWSESPDLRELMSGRVGAPDEVEGLTHVLAHVAWSAAISSASLSAAIPAYVGSAPQPKGVLALLNALEDLIGTSLPQGDWEEQAQAWQVGADQFVEEDPDLAEYVQELESIQSAEDLHEASGDAIAREFERFMRRRQDDR